MGICCHVLKDSKRSAKRSKLAIVNNSQSTSIGDMSEAIAV